ncbi:MAG TPA: tetratricopeptide repeat protein [Terriglobales bacterium]|nr:tetratricopeptide repeat protein [Terriglobales bacterium]
MPDEPKPFFRNVMDDMLDAETARHIAEQKAAVDANPSWAEGHYHLAQLYRIQQRAQDAKRELLIALEMKPLLAEAHMALGEIYISEGDLDKAREHAEIAAQLGNGRLRDQLSRYGQF